MWFCRRLFVIDAKIKKAEIIENFNVFGPSPNAKPGAAKNKVFVEIYLLY